VKSISQINTYGQENNCSLLTQNALSRCDVGIAPARGRIDDGIAGATPRIF
jgi:hypothetical protein